MTPPIEIVGLRTAVELSVRAEELGYTDVWTAESSGADAFSPLAALAVQTKRVRLGTALIPVFTRPPALAAMSAAGIQVLSGGRFVLGLGTSSRVIVASWMGLEYRNPLEMTREYVEVLRQALAGRKISYSGRALHAEGFRLQLDPGQPVPIYIGALGPETCRLAGRIGDGVLFFLMTPEGVRAARLNVVAGAEEMGRDLKQLDVFLRIPVLADEPTDRVRYQARRMMTGYAVVPAYNSSLARQGFEQEARRIAEAWSSGERESAIDHCTNEMLDEFFVPADPEACQKRVEQFREAGVTTPVLMPVSFAPTLEERSQRVDAAIRILAPQS